MIIILTVTKCCLFHVPSGQDVSVSEKLNDKKEEEEEEKITFVVSDTLVNII